MMKAIQVRGVCMKYQGNSLPRYPPDDDDDGDDASAGMGAQLPPNYRPTTTEHDDDGIKQYRS